jgi:hypothetical protein
VSEGAGDSGISIYLAILIAGFAVTYVWRFLGALAVTTLHPESEVLLWVRAVATALVAHWWPGWSPLQAGFWRRRRRWRAMAGSPSGC